MAKKILKISRPYYTNQLICKDLKKRTNGIKTNSSVKFP
ncbi:unnamed protein product, partial [marine sediment metagenome]